MAEQTKIPKVFISYSWSSPEHEQWVVNLGERLFLDGIGVKLDKWDLKEGQDKYDYMEQMVKDADISKVLVICDSTYKDKADNRIGGAGTETQIISKEVYDKTDQEKYIPIITEFDDNCKPCVPAFLESRIYLDFSNDSVYEESYEKMIRNIYGKPLFKNLF